MLMVENSVALNTRVKKGHYEIYKSLQLLLISYLVLHF
jgi:hypothetical protein